MPPRPKFRLRVIAGIIIAGVAGVVAKICGAAAERFGADEGTATLVMTVSFFLVVIVGTVAYRRYWFR
jgi:hypothetical protein